MGLLDDAIKEHLELKRRHGADPTEVARQEREALGPVRRAEVEPSHAPEAPDAGVVSVFDTDDDRAPEAAADVEWDVAEPADAAAHVEPEAPARPPRWEEPDDEPFAPPTPEPEPEEPRAARPDAAPPVEEPPPTVEHRIAPEPPSRSEEPRGDDNDVLEETPEFLEETPEHDRLWFEQRPPRDFDFDG